MKRNFDCEFKSRVLLEALRGERTIAEIDDAYQVHLSESANAEGKHLLLKRIGRLEVENDFLRGASFAIRSQAGKSK